MISSPIRKLAPYAKRCQDEGVTVLRLNIGQPDIETPEEFFDAIRNVDMSVLEYEDSQGSRTFIQSTIDYYRRWNIDYAFEDIIVTQGASEALIFALATICDPGDEVLVPEPFYSNYSNFAGMLNIELVPMTTYARDGFRLPDLDTMEKRVTDRTKAIMITNPGNPTGRVYTEDEQNAICQLVLRNNLFLISDEVYKEFVYDGLQYKSFAHYPELEQHLLLIDSISKRYSCCGARIGTVASKNRHIMANISKLAQARLCVSTLEQIGACALNEVSHTYLTSVVSKYESRRNLVFEHIANMPGVLSIKPNGAFYNILSLPVDDAETFTLWVLENVRIDGETILLTPAESFYLTPAMGVNEVRITYCINEEKLGRAMAILKKALETYPGRTTV